MRPGDLAEFQLQQLTRSGTPYNYQFIYQDVPGNSVNLLFDPTAVLVGVKVIILDLPGQQVPLTTEALAQLWFDGRSVNRGPLYRSNGGSASLPFVDMDPRPDWSGSDFDNVGNGRRNTSFTQEIDSIWSQCGDGRTARGVDIQFRLVSFHELSAATIPSNCYVSLTDPQWISTSQASATSWCIGNLAAIVDALDPPGPPTIHVFIARYADLNPRPIGGGTAAAAAFFGAGILLDERETITSPGYSPYPAAHSSVIAHEIGHYLGEWDPLFQDSPVGLTHNLMSTFEPILSPQQCLVARTMASTMSLR